MEVKHLRTVNINFFMLASSASWRCWLALGGGGLKCNDDADLYLAYDIWCAD